MHQAALVLLYSGQTDDVPGGSCQHGAQHTAVQRGIAAFMRNHVLFAGSVHGLQIVMLQNDVLYQTVALKTSQVCDQFQPFGQVAINGEDG